MNFFKNKNVIKDKKKVAETLTRILTITQEVEEAIQYQKSKTPNYHEMERLVRENYHSETGILNDIIARQENVYDKTLEFIGASASKHNALLNQLESVPDIVERSSVKDFSRLKDDVGNLESSVQSIAITYSKKTSGFLSSFSKEVKKYTHQ